MSVQHASGHVMKVDTVAIDTGGHSTHQVYNYVRSRPARKFFAVKGETRPGRPVKGASTAVDVNWRGKVLKRSVKLWFVGTDTAKDLIHGRLQVAQPGPGYIHFTQDLPPAFYAQLTAEKRVPVRTSRGVESRWVQPSGVRNEVLDCTVYAIFCSHMLGLHTYTNAMWSSRIESVVQPATGDLFAQAPLPVAEEKVEGQAKPEPAPVTLPPPAPRRRGLRAIGRIGGGPRW